MRTCLLTVIAAFLLSIPLLDTLDFDFGGIQVDRISTSAIIVMALAVFFSLVAWLILSAVSKNLRPAGSLLSIITGASLTIPFLHVLGPISGIPVGVVAGFSAFTLQKKMVNFANNHSIITACTTLVISYVVLAILVLVINNTDDGVGTWSGTIEGIEESGIDNTFGNVGFAHVLVIVSSLAATIMILYGKNE